MKNYLALILTFTLSLPTLQAKDSEWSVRDNLEKAEQNLSKDPAKAIYYGGQALTAATSSKEQDQIAKAQYIIASAYINIGDYVTSYEYLVEAEKNCPESDKRLMGDILLSTSYTYQKIKDFDRAFRYLEKAQEIFENLKDTLSIARCANNKGLIYIAIPDNEKAEKCFEESLRLNRMIGNKPGIAQNLNNMSFIDGDPQTTISQLKEAISINESLNRTWVLGENYNNLGYQYRRAGNHSAALDALARARAYADMSNGKELIMDNYRYRSEVFAETGDFRNAYSDLKALLDQIESQDMTGGLKNIEVNLMEKNIQTIRKEKEQKEKEYRLKRSIAIALIALLAAVCLVVAISYRVFRKANKKQKELMQKELDLKKKELDNFAIWVKSRNEILAGIQDKIKDIYGMETGEATRQLKKLNSSISQFNRTNEEAEKMIDELNSGFISKLAEAYPDLSNSEMRLASLLKIGMSSKEISLILSMEPKSVDMARYRLRKKLNLSGNDNLCDFLGKI